MTRRSVAVLIVLCLAVSVWAAAPASDFRFVILGDRTGGARQEVYVQTWAEIDKYRPEFVINVGDTIQGTSDEIAEGQWKEIRAFLDQHKRFPFYMVPGNHDIWNDFSKSLFERESGRAANYSFDYQGAHFIVLDNSRDDLLAPSQLQFLEESLKKNRERRPKFVFFHKPFWLMLLRAENRGFPLHALAKEYGVDYVLSGHGHQFVRLVRDGVTYTEVGSSGANIGEPSRPDSDFAKGSFYHFVQVQVKGAQATFTVKELDDPFGKGRSLDAAHWSESGGLRAPAASNQTH
jgi:3',5'-cyclic AMP phosphodiesterase CpdA